MSLYNLEDARRFKSTTLAIAQDPRTPLTLHELYTWYEIHWKKIELDYQLFGQIVEFFWNTRTLPDEEFRALIPQIRTVMEESAIFQNLGSTDIKVTEGHAGRRPLNHTFDVLERVSTTHPLVTLEQKFALRLSVLYHDTGKMQSAGIPIEEIDSVIGATKPERHSFPNHDLLSLRIVEKLIAICMSAGNEAVIAIPSETWNLVKLIIHNHHLFEFKQGELDELRQQMPSIIDNPVLCEAFFLTFLLFYADITSIPSYANRWPDKLRIFRELVSPHARTLDPGWELFFDTIDYCFPEPEIDESLVALIAIAKCFQQSN